MASYRRLTSALVVLSTLGGCGSAAHSTQGVAHPVAVAVPEGATRKPTAPPPSHPPVPEDVVMRAAGPFHGRRTVDGKELTKTEFFDELSRFDVICVGERHGTPTDHFAELSVLRGLLDRAPISGRYMSLGLEMVERQFQEALGALRNSTISDGEFLETVEWDKRWGYDFAYYEPTLRLARQAGLPIWALNARAELVSRVAQKGLDQLNPSQNQEMPELDLHDAAHHRWFTEATAEHPKPAGQTAGGTHLYEAQVVRDETMASRIDSKLAGVRPASQMVVLAGLGHCRRDAIPERVLRRSPDLQVAAVVPVTVTSSASAPELEKTSPLEFDYEFVLER